MDLFCISAATLCVHIALRYDMPGLFYAASIALCIMFALQHETRFLVTQLHGAFYANTTSVWRVEVLFAVAVRIVASAISTVLLLRMLNMLVRVVAGWGCGGAAANKKGKIVFIYPGLRHHEDMDPDSNCVICLCEGNRNVVLECGHAFHWACIYPWLDARNTCPLCMRQQRREYVHMRLSRGGS